MSDAPTRFTIPPGLLLVIIVIIGFLTGATIYFYNRGQTKTTTSSSSGSYSGDHPSLPAQDDTAIKSLTKPANAKGVSYPANVYAVQAKDTLFGISSKLSIPLSLIESANNLTDSNHLQAGANLVIPVLDSSTDLYRLNFILNVDKIETENASLRSQSSSDWFDPAKVARQSAPPYFGLKSDSDYKLSQADLGKGEALIRVTIDSNQYNIGLIQPKIKGERGMWVMTYIEANQ